MGLKDKDSIEPAKKSEIRTRRSEYVSQLFYETEREKSRRKREEVAGIKRQNGGGGV